MDQRVPHSSGDLKTYLAELNDNIRAAHFSGATGSEVVQRRTALIDRTLRDLHGQLSANGSMPSVVAVGGYGRGELNPYSDIDIMFLCRDDRERQRAPDLLYVLWDAGLDVGYSVRTTAECVSLARQDIKIRTSLLESRLIAGTPALYGSYLATMRSDVFYWRPADYVAQKLAERNATRQKYGGSIYLREPNIKDGAGGLRDVHTALWISFVHFKVSSLAELVDRGVLTDGQYAVFSRSRNFLWNVRNEIHYLSGRKNDHLTFDLQEQTARDFRYRDSAHLLAVERFMKAYFIHARNIREFSNIVAEAVLPKPSRRWFQRSLELGRFSLVGKTLAAHEDDCAGDPAAMLEAFRHLQSRHAVPSERLKAMIRSCRVDDGSRSSPEASALFRAILDDPVNLSATLSLMKDLRFLGRYIPEFRAIQALARHDYYHLYAVDEHILLAIQHLEQLWAGNYPSLATLRTAFAGLPKRWLLMLTVLLHDLGKAFREDHEKRGAEIAAVVLDRVGITGEDRDRILFLIANHLVMSSLSQRRELNDHKVIADFARLVGDRENLALLYLLTYADIAAVNLQSWTQWKAVLLQDLFLKTLNHLESSAQTAGETRVRLAAAAARVREAALERFTSEEVDAFLGSMPEAYLLYASTRRVLEHLDMLRRLPDDGLVIQYRHFPDRGYTELTVCAYDAYGMFYRTAGTIASKNLNILRAQVYTSRRGVMIDTFQITDAQGGLCPYDDAWESLRVELRAALIGGTRTPEPGLYAANRHIPGALEPAVEFDNETSDVFTIIDITARDHVGLLYRVTRTLYDLNLDIGSAKIVTEGARALDSFYITDLLRKKIVDPERLRKIREKLLEAAGRE